MLSVDVKTMFEMSAGERRTWQGSGDVTAYHLSTGDMRRGESGRVRARRGSSMK